VLKPTLTDGWNLTAFDSSVDTKIPETITAVANLAQAATKAATAGMTGRMAVSREEKEKKIEEYLKQRTLSPGLYAIVGRKDGGGLALDTEEPVFQAKGTICKKLTAVAKPAPSPTPSPAK